MDEETSSSDEIVLERNDDNGFRRIEAAEELTIDMEERAENFDSVFNVLYLLSLSRNHGKHEPCSTPRQAVFQ